jgi:Modulator of levamisole receptor-1
MPPSVISNSTMVGRRRCRPRPALVLLAWLALAGVSRARIQASASTNETEPPLPAGIRNESSTAAETVVGVEPTGFSVNKTGGGGVASGRHAAASASSSSKPSLIASSIVMDEDPCLTSFRHVCDPDGILSADDVQRLQQEIDDVPRSVSCQGKDVAVQVAVALVSKVRAYIPDSEKVGTDRTWWCRHASLSSVTSPSCWLTRFGLFGCLGC